MELALEPTTDAPLDEYLAMALRNRERLSWWEPWAAQPVSEATIRQYLAWVARESAAGRQVARIVRVDGALAGSIGARVGVGYAEIGYWLDAGAEGRGVATRAVTGLLDELAARGVTRVEAFTAVDNTRSIALLERLGFARDDAPPPPVPLDLPRGRIPRHRFARSLSRAEERRRAGHATTRPEARPRE